MVPYRTVDAQLDPKLRHKIWQNEFINLRLLSKPEFADANQMLKLDQQGNIQTHEVLKGHIKGIVEWNKAWRVFMLTALQKSHTQWHTESCSINKHDHIHALH